MTTTFIISETKLRDFTDLNNNVDSLFLKNAVRIGQDIEIQRILGTKLYKRILSDIDASTLTGNYATLVNDYVVDALLFWAYYYALEDIYVRPRNNGVLRATGGENSESVDLNLFNVKRQSAKNKAEWYSEKLSEYLIENTNTFPELNESTKLYEDIPDYSVQYSSPFQFRSKGYGSHIREAMEAGLGLSDSRYPFLPPPQYRKKIK